MIGFFLYQVLFYDGLWMKGKEKLSFMEDSEHRYLENEDEYPKPSEQQHEKQNDEDDEGNNKRIVTSDMYHNKAWSHGRQLNIVTLGGSVTWGASVTPRENAYPFLLRDYDGHNVTNIAIRATGSDYPAQCLKSLLHSLENNEEQSYHEDMAFDVIIFDFSINGMVGFDLLLDRLLTRYPDALLLYVDLWSLKQGSAFDSSKSRDLIEKAGGYVYFFGNRGPPTDYFDYRQVVNKGENIEEQIEGRPELKALVDYFANDKHHLSYLGHKLVRHEIRNMINQYGNFPDHPRLGSWLGGDQCTLWFNNGYIPEDAIEIVSGGMMKEWDEEKDKYGIEVQQDGGGVILRYTHNSDTDAPLSIQYMTKENDKYDVSTSMYPAIISTIKQDKESILDSQKSAISTDFPIEASSNSVSYDFTPVDGWEYISSLNKRMGLRTFHVTETGYLGTVKPGTNFILLYPLMERPYPFRITATIICEACGKLGYDTNITPEI